jgi:hypothetical protein
MGPDAAGPAAPLVADEAQPVAATAAKATEPPRRVRRENDMESPGVNEKGGLWPDAMERSGGREMTPMGVPRDPVRSEATEHETIGVAPHERIADQSGAVRIADHAAPRIVHRPVRR